MCIQASAIFTVHCGHSMVDNQILRVSKSCELLSYYVYTCTLCGSLLYLLLHETPYKNTVVQAIHFQLHSYPHKPLHQFLHLLRLAAIIYYYNFNTHFCRINVVSWTNVEFSRNRILTFGGIVEMFFSSTTCKLSNTMPAYTNEMLCFWRSV